MVTKLAQFTHCRFVKEIGVVRDTERENNNTEAHSVKGT